MKRVLILGLSLAIICWGGAVFAQQSRDLEKQGQERKEGIQTQDQGAAQSQGIQSQDVANWKGKEIKALNDEELGTIKDVVTDNQGQGQFAVVSVSGNKLVVPIEALSTSSDGKDLRLNMTKDQLKDAPKFSKEILADRSYTAEVYRFYGIEPRWSEQPSGTRGTTPGATPGGSTLPGSGSYGSPGSTGTPGGSSPSSSGSSSGASQGEPTGQAK